MYYIEGKLDGYAFIKLGVKDHKMCIVRARAKIGLGMSFCCG